MVYGDIAEDQWCLRSDA